MKESTEGWPIWFRTRRRAAADYVRALDSIEQAAAAIERILCDWGILDDQLKSSLLHSAVIHYARPFSFKPNYGGRRLHRHPLFDLELHGHLLKLRNDLIAHHVNETLRAQVGHGYADLSLSGSRTTVLIATHCVVKALHSIENRTVAERYARHFTACVDCFKQIAKERLEVIHNMALQLPGEAAADMDTLASGNLSVEQAVFRTRIPSVLEMGAERIPNPVFPLPPDAYKYRIAEMTHFRMGKYEIETPEGQVVIQLSDLPFEEPIQGERP